MRRRTLMITWLAVLGATAAPSAVDAKDPSCLTPVAADRHEPLCAPWAAWDWAMPHRGGYEQDSTPYAGPVSPSGLTLQHVMLKPGTLPFLQFTHRYADGGREAWFSEVSSPDQERIGKVDVGSGALLAEVDGAVSPSGSPSGAYSVLDHAGHFVVGRNQQIKVFADETRGVRSSGIALLRTLQLPPEALCGAGDKLVGIILTWQGLVAFATANGVVGVVPDNPARMTPAHVHAISINSRSSCDAGQPAEKVSNSIAADEHAGIYTVTSGALYKHVVRRGRVREAWRAAYPSDGYQGGIRLGTGSGSSPTLMGTSSRDDKLVVITDGRRVMHYRVMWRDRVPRRWKPIAKGVDRRVACDVRVDFGNPAIPAAQSEQSVGVRGYGAVVVNNSLKNSSAFDVLPMPQNYTVAALSSGEPSNAAHGMERIDWNPKTRRCRVVWTNSEVSIPNAIPTISSGSRTVYAIGQRNGTWGLEGVSFSSGHSRLRFDTGADPSHNSLYADTEVLPRGEVWTGTSGGIDIIRPARPTRLLPLRCTSPHYTHCRAKRHRRA